MCSHCTGLTPLSPWHFGLLKTALMQDCVCDFRFCDFLFSETRFLVVTVNSFSFFFLCVRKSGFFEWLILTLKPRQVFVRASLSFCPTCFPMLIKNSIYLGFSSAFLLFCTLPADLLQLAVATLPKRWRYFTPLKSTALVHCVTSLALHSSIQSTSPCFPPHFQKLVCFYFFLMIILILKMINITVVTMIHLQPTWRLL